MEPVRDQSAYYYTRELIDNLQIRVSLQQLRGMQLVDASPRMVEDTSGGRDAEFSLVSFSVPPIPTSDSSNSYTQQEVIKWQQKLLSACEALEYGHPEYANHPKYKSWHEQAMKVKKRKQWKRRLFTYIHQDNYQYQAQNAVTTSKRHEQDSWIRQRKNMTSAENHKINDTDVSEGSGEADKKSPKSHELKQFPHLQHFYIMADLAPPESLGKSRAHEVVLCALYYSMHGQLTITPDFNKPSTKPYRIESFGCDNALYEYTIENISLTHSREEQCQDNLVQQIAQQRLESMQQIVGLDWNEQLHKGELRMLMTGEITRALHFTEATSLYVHYVLHLPQGWRANNGTECEGFTPTCAVDYVDSTHIAHYSTPFSIDVTRSKSGRGWPLLLLAAFSVDWFGQDRNEGYAAFALPSLEKDIGAEVYSVSTWRPAQLSPLASLRRFFLGGCQLITDSSYLAFGNSTEVERVSRLGFVTLTSGSIELNINTMAQKDSTETDMTVQEENSSGWQQSTLAIINAFNRSRQKLRAAKQGLFENQ